MTFFSTTYHSIYYSTLLVCGSVVGFLSYKRKENQKTGLPSPIPPMTTAILLTGLRGYAQRHPEDGEAVVEGHIAV